MSNKKRNPTTVEIIAQKFKVRPSYVTGILKIGRVKPINFVRMRDGRMSVYAAYTDAKKEESGDIPELPKVKPVVYHQTSSDPFKSVEYTYTEKSKKNDDSIFDESAFFPDSDEATTWVDGGQPTPDLKQVRAYPNKKMIKDEPIGDNAVFKLDDNHIEFKCPCSCQRTYIINLNTLSYEAR